MCFFSFCPSPPWVKLSSDDPCVKLTNTKLRMVFGWCQVECFKQRTTRESVRKGVCARICVYVCACVSLPRGPVSISLCVFTVAKPKSISISCKASQWATGKHLALWGGEKKPDLPRLDLPLLPPTAIMRFSRFILPRRHDRLRNYKGPISQEGITTSPGDRRANRIERCATRAYGAAAWVGGTWLRGGGDTVTWMENVPLFLVICVSKSFDWWPSGCFSHSPLRFPALLWGGFNNGPLL